MEVRDPRSEVSEAATFRWNQSLRARIRNPVGGRGGALETIGPMYDVAATTLSYHFLATARLLLKTCRSIVKRSIRGTHVHVSRRHLAKYFVEFEFRWNLRDVPEAMFPLLLKRLAT